MIQSVLAVKTRYSTIGDESVTRIAKYPLRHSKFGLHRSQCHDFPIALFVQIPPTGTIRNKVEPPVRTPLRLKDRFVISASHMPYIREITLLTEIRYPKVRPI